MTTLLGTIKILTFKEGLLSKVAHDLQLDLARFEVQIEGDTIKGRFLVDSIRVDGAVKDGKLCPDTLSAKDQRDILENIREKVLWSAKFPESSLEGTLKGERGEGTLKLAGRAAPVSWAYRVSNGRYLGEVELVPTRWGIVPFKALLGAIKVQDRVLVRFELSPV